MTLPEKLFRFQTLNKNNLRALKAGKLWFSSVDKFNDPFEFCCDLLSELLPSQLPIEQDAKEQLINSVCEHIGENHRQKLRSIVIHANDVDEYHRYAQRSMHEALRDVLLQIGVCCFFPNVNDGLSWGHYGNLHRGFAMGISTSRLDLSVLKLEKVTYSKTPPRFFPQSSNNAMARKSLDWKHEQEWRFLAPRANTLIGHGDGSKVWPIYEVYFGGRMTGDDKLKIREQVGGEISFFDAIFSSDKYGLTFVESNFETENRGF